MPAATWLIHFGGRLISLKPLRRVNRPALKFVEFVLLLVWVGAWPCGAAQLEPSAGLAVAGRAAIRASWLPGANILQPAGHSQYADLIDAGDRAARLKTELGFNTIVLAPADVNNIITSQKIR